MNATWLRSRRVLLGVAASLAVALGVAFLLLRPRLERAFRARIEAEAARRGATLRLDGVRVGLLPPVRLTGVRLEKGGASFASQRIDLWLRAWGSGLVGRTTLDLDGLTLDGPAGFSVVADPTQWKLIVAQEGLRAELRRPTRGLALSWLPDGGGRAELLANGAESERLFTLRRNGSPALEVRALDGRASVAGGEATRFEMDVASRGVRLASLAGEEEVQEGAAPAFGEPTDVTLRLRGSWDRARGALELPQWALRIEGASLSGSLALRPERGDHHLDVSLEVERVDFGELLKTSGVDQPDAVASPALAAAGDLGSASLSARAQGRLGNPASFTVTQRLDFTPPRRRLPALDRLRGDFVHTIELPEGKRRTIAVSPSSPDFVPIGDVPALFVRTLLIAEDSGFWGHQGIDLSELPAAILKNRERGEPIRGASTLTQQLAKNLFLSRERQLGRKLQELSLALLLESTLSKQRILEIYLNVIEWGPGIHGLRPAARHYFAREPWELTPRQIAFLVALIPGPIKYQSSFADGTPSAGFSRLVDTLLVKLRSVDALGEEEYQASRAEELIVFPGADRGDEPGAGQGAPEAPWGLEPKQDAGRRRDEGRVELDRRGREPSGDLVPRELTEQ